jgi:hypothetical protein
MYYLLKNIYGSIFGHVSTTGIISRSLSSEPENKNENTVELGYNVIKGT